MKYLTMAAVILCGSIIATAMFFDKLVVVCAFGFMLNALLIVWSKK